MFWFKNKVELKKKTSIMSSFYNRHGLKLDTEIVVPDNFELLIFHKEKYYKSLYSGKYKVDKNSFSTLIEKQQKHKRKLKYIKCVTHYINLSNQKIQVKTKKQIYSIEFKIENAIKFASLALLYSYKVDDEYVLNMLNDMFIELLIYYKHDCKQIKENSLINYGLTILNISPINQKISLFNNQKRNEQTLTAENNSLNFDSNPSEKPSVSSAIDNTLLNSTIKEETISTNSKVNESPNNTHTIQSCCPKCNNVCKFNTTYCLRCGYKLH